MTTVSREVVMMGEHFVVAKEKTKSQKFSYAFLVQI